MPKQKPSTHPLAPVYAAYDAAYNDHALHGQKDRVDTILKRTVEAARVAGFEVENFDRDLYPMLRPWIIALGEPKGSARWRADLVELAQELLDYQPQDKVVHELKARAKAIGYPLGERQAGELLRDVQLESKAKC